MENKELSLKEIQQGSFEVLKEIKKICDENNIIYYLIYGTLLGAVRHKGFIPWDDDIDIMMPRKDYERFVKYCIKHKKDLEPFQLIHYKTNKNYIYPIARMSDSRYKIVDNIKDYGLGLFVDIYPFDGIDDNDLEYIDEVYKIDQSEMIAGRIENIQQDESFFKNLYINHLKKVGVSSILKDLDKKAQKYSYEKSDKVKCTCWEIKTIKSIDKKFIDKGERELTFNNISFRVPYDYDKVLKLYYNDYMKLPPENERIGHHNYKAYKK